MADGLSTEHASVITKDFPVVVIKETGELGDDERVQVIDRIDALLDEGNPHAIILDLTAAANLPESQLMFLSEALQLREDQIAETWISLAILSPDPKSELTTFWLKATSTQAQAFTNMMSAVVWTRQALDRRTQPTPSISPEDRRSRVTEAGSRASTPRASDPPDRKKEAPKNGRPAKKQTLNEWLRTRQGKSASAMMGICALLWLLGPSGAMSWFDAARFSQQKNALAVRVFAAAKGQKDTPFRSGQALSSTQNLRFEVDLPATAYLMLMGVGKDGHAYAVWPKSGGRSAGPINKGKGVRVPALIELNPTLKREWFHFVACPSRINASECSAQKQGATLDCPSSCLVSSISVAVQ